MTERVRQQIAGRFQKINNNPVIIGVIGNLYVDDLSDEQMNYIKGFYNCENKKHTLAIDYPKAVDTKINRSRNYNGFIIIKD